MASMNILHESSRDVFSHNNYTIVSARYSITIKRYAREKELYISVIKNEISISENSISEKSWLS